MKIKTYLVALSALACRRRNVVVAVDETAELH